MPPIDKALKRDRQRQKARNAKFLGVRYQTLRAGESLATWEARRKTTLEGKAAQQKKRKK